MYFIPYHSFEISTHGTIAEVVDFVTRYVEPARLWSNPEDDDSAEFVGTVDERGFRIRVPWPYFSVMSTIVRGQFIQMGPGVVIEISMRPGAFALPVLGFGLLIWAMSAAFLISILLGPSNP